MKYIKQMKKLKGGTKMHDLIKNCRKKYNRGITLIALVITIALNCVRSGRKLEYTA